MRKVKRTSGKKDENFSHMCNGKLLSVVTSLLFGYRQGICFKKLVQIHELVGQLNQFLNMTTVPSLSIFFAVIFFVTCEDVCEVNRVQYGEVLREVLIPIRNSSGHQIGTRTVFYQVDMSSSKASGSSLYVRCNDPYRFQGDRVHELAEIVCTNGKWVPFPVCLIPPCDKRSLGFRGLEKGGHRTLFHGESFEPRCQHGYKIAEKADKRIHCENGLWTGNLPPCTSEVQCRLPEKPDYGSVELVQDSATVGSVVVFKCDPERKLVGSVVSRCNRLGEWTSPTPKCVAPCKTESLLDFDGLLVETRRPLDDGEWFEPRCDEEYEIANGTDSKIYCRDGNWEGNLPPCVPAGKSPCKTEFLERFKGLIVENKRALADGEWFQARCEEGYKVADKNNPRIDCRDGVWHGNFPPCATVKSEVQCEPPEKPEHGSVELVGNSRTVGSAAVFSCDTGRQLIGSVASFCNKAGKWTSPPPACAAQCDMKTFPVFEGLAVESLRTLNDGEWFRPTCDEGFELVNESDPKIYCRDGNWEGTIPPCSSATKKLCHLPYIPNGSLWRYVKASDRFGWKPLLEEVTAEENINEEESVVLQCNDGYNPRGQTDEDITITCLDGELSPEPECVGRRKQETHGYIIKNDIAHARGKGLCDKKTLNFTGLIVTEGRLLSGQSFEPVCLTGYEVTETSDTRIYCFSGVWTGNLPPCTPKRIPCETEVLLEFSGVILSSPRVVDDGAWIEPMCSDGYDLVDKNSTKLYCRQGHWEGTLPLCYPAPCLSNPPVPANGRIKPTWWKVDHGATVEYECLRNFEMTKAGNVACNFGTWTGSIPTCKDSRCYLRNLLNKEGVDLSKDEPVRPFKKPAIKCIEGYILKYPEVRCVKGVWQTQTNLSPCQQSGCEIMPIEYGEMLTAKIYSDDSFGMDTVYESAAVGSFITNGESMYVSCREPYEFRGEGNEDFNEVTCQRGSWVPFPECLRTESTSTCSTTSLVDLLPDEVISYIDEDIDVSPGFDVKLGCIQYAMVFVGDSSAVCGTDGTWSIGRDIRCAHGCESLKRSSDSELIISSDKAFYQFGDSITFSCPKGKTLTTDTERMACLKYGWEPKNLPDCR